MNNEISVIIDKMVKAAEYIPNKTQIRHWVSNGGSVVVYKDINGVIWYSYRVSKNDSFSKQVRIV